MIARLLRRVARAISDMNYAQRRVTTLMSAPDRVAPNAAKAPDTYAEFLYRTSGPLMREPSAAHRARGQLIH
ncbi:MAG TPA: hypothetical protein VF070_11655 [Streptosporangiaceae bacterium]